MKAVIEVGVISDFFQADFQVTAPRQQRAHDGLAVEATWARRTRLVRKPDGVTPRADAERHEIVSLTRARRRAMQLALQLS